MVGYYVTLRRDSRTAWLAGPFATLPDALRTVPAAVRAAEAVDSMTVFDAHGTARLERAALPPGRLNDRLDLVRGANGYVRVAAGGAHASGRARRRGAKGGAIRLFAARRRALRRSATASPRPTPAARTGTAMGGKGQPRGPDGKFLCVAAYPRLRKSTCGCGGGGSHPCPIAKRLRPVREAAKRSYRPRRFTPADLEEIERELYGVQIEREALVDALEYVRTQIQQTGSTHHRLGARSFETHGARLTGKHGGRSFSAGPDQSEMAYKRLLEERLQLRAHDAHLRTQGAVLRRELAAATRALGRRSALAGAARWRREAAAPGIRPGVRVLIPDSRGAYQIAGVVEAVYAGQAHVRYAPSLGRSAHAVVPLGAVRLAGSARRRRAQRRR